MVPKTLIEVIRENRCLPIIGAGFSLNGKLSEGKTMPTWTQLAKMLAEKIKTNETDPLLVFQEFQEKTDRPTLIHTIEKLLHKDEAKPGHVHRHLVKISDFDVIVTTNYDDLLESACKQEGRPVKVIVEKQQISLYGSDKELKIYKMHGDLDHPSELIITKKDYDDYQEKKNEFDIVLSNLLMMKSPLFLGFSLNDRNFKQIKNKIDTLMEEKVRRGYIVLFDPSEKEIEEYQKLSLQVIPIETNGRSKSDCLLEFVKEIQQQPATQDISTLTVSANKTVLFKNQKLEIRTFTAETPTQQIPIRIEKRNGETVFKSDMNDSKILEKGLLSKEIILKGDEWEEGQDYTVFAEWQGQEISDSFTISKPTQIVAQTDKSVYIYGSDIILTAIVPQASEESEITYQIINEDRKPVQTGKIPIFAETTGIFQQLIKVEGKHWKKRGSEFEILVEYGNKKASVNVFTSNFGATIELDQRVYTWTDKVRITIVAPDFARDSDKVDYIGDDEDNLVSIHTNKGTLRKYKLKETGPDTGIFVGEITLTGFPGSDIKGKTIRKYPFGITRGSGPIDGLLSCLEEDIIKVLFQFSNEEVFSASAIVRWNIGEIHFLEPSYSMNDYATVRVIDPDMNLDPNEIDSFNIRIWSDSDKKGIDIPVYETGKETGIFEGLICFDPNESSNSGKLKVSEGDTVEAEYLDQTLPSPYTRTNSLTISGTTKIFSNKRNHIPLEQLQIEDVSITNLIPSKGKKISQKDTAKINVNITNKDESRSFVALAEIKDNNGVVVDLISRPLTIDRLSMISASFWWHAKFSGKYKITVFLWAGIDNPEALCQPVEKEIEITSEN